MDQITNPTAASDLPNQDIRHGGFITYTTTKSVEKTLADLDEVAPRHKFGVLNKLNLKQKLKSKGLEYDRDTHVIEICSPPIAKGSLETDIRIASLLPCRVAVYEHKDSETGEPITVVQSMNPALVLALFGEPLEEQIKKVEASLHDIMKETCA